MGRSLRAVMITLIAIVGLAGCGGEGSAPTPTASQFAQVGASGPILQGLTTGRQVIAPDGRYSLFVPADWIEVQAGISEVAFRSPDIDDSETFSISREHLAEIRRAQVYAEAGRRSVSAIYSNVLTMSMTAVQIGEVEAYRWLYTANVGSTERLVYQVFIVDGNEGFVITGFAPATSDFNEMQRLFDSITGSMSFAVG